jgi:hypothetical protein
MIGFFEKCPIRSTIGGKRPEVFKKSPAKAYIVQPKVRRVLGIAALLCIALAAALEATAVTIGVREGARWDAYLEEEEIDVEYYFAPGYDGVTIAGLCYTMRGVLEESPGSRPAVLMIPGINSRKEFFFPKVYHMVKNGYVVFTMENRGHGESTGLGAFWRWEGYDVVGVIDYLFATYAVVDQARLGLMTFSYGSSVGVIAQALDDRIACTVAYHPVASVERINENAPMEFLLSAFPGFPPRGGWANHSAVNYVTPENTANLLLLHGDADTTVPSTSSVDIFEKAGGATRSDVQVIIRPGLDHGPNEKNPYSFQLALTWFRVFLLGDSVELTELEAIASEQVLLVPTPPAIVQITDLLRWVAALLYLGVCIGLIVIIDAKTPQLTARRTQAVIPATTHDITVRIAVTVGTFTVLGIMVRAGLVNFLLGVIAGFAIPGACSFVIPKQGIRGDTPGTKVRREIHSWLDPRAVGAFLIPLIAVAVGAAAYRVTHAWHARLTLSEPMPAWGTTGVFYFVMFGLTLFSVLALMRDLRGRQFLWTLVPHALGLLIFGLLNPLPPMVILPETWFVAPLLGVVGALLPLIVTILGQVGKLIKNQYVVPFLIEMIAVIALIGRFARFF